MNEIVRVRTAKPAVSSNEIVDRMNALQCRPKPPPTSAIVNALKAPDVSPWHEDHVGVLMASLDAMDPQWSARVTIVERFRPSRRSVFAATLVERLVEQARAASAYPLAVNSEESDQRQLYTEWATDAMTRTSEPLPGGMLVTALWPDRRNAWFGEVVVALLAAWSVTPKRPKPDVVANIAVRLFAAGMPGRKRATDITAVGAFLRSRVEAATAQARESLDAAGRARDARFRVEDQLRHTRTELEAARGESTRALAAVAAIESQMNALDARTRTELLSVRTDAANEAGRLRTRTLSVLRHESEQIRLYLDRSNPNVPEVLARLRFLDELKRDLEGEVIQ